MTIDVDPVALSPVEWAAAKRAKENRWNLALMILMAICEAYLIIFSVVQIGLGVERTTTFWVRIMQTVFFAFMCIYLWTKWRSQASAKSISSVVSWDAEAIEKCDLVNGQVSGSSRILWADLFLFRRRADSFLLCSRQGMLILPYDLFQTEDQRQSIIDAASEAMEANRSRKFRRGWGNSRSDD